MSFDNLPPQSSMNPNADAYALECLDRSRAAALDVRPTMDMRCGADHRQSMDIYRPETVGRLLPVLIYFHGGGYTHGRKEWCGFMAPAITAFPAIFVSASYRLQPDVNLPEIMGDGRAAVAWVRNNISKFGGDGNRIFIGGHSAGANIAANILLDITKRRDAGIDDACIRAVFGMSGSYTHYTGYGNVSPDRGPASDQIQNVLESPGLSKPRFHVSWGAKERAPFPQAGKAFSKALADAGMAVESLEFPQDDHFSVHLNTGSPDNAWTLKLREWMHAAR